MNPVKTEFTNIVYHAPPGAADVQDLPCLRIDYGIVKSVWKPTDIERAMITSGASIEVVMFTEPHPPISVSVTSERELP